MGNDESCSCLPNAVQKDFDTFVSLDNKLILDYCVSNIDEKEGLLIDELKRIRKIQKKKENKRHKHKRKHQRNSSNKLRIKRNSSSNNNHPFPSIISEPNEEEKLPINLKFNFNVSAVNAMSDMNNERSTSMPTPVPDDYILPKLTIPSNMSTEMDSEVWKYLADHPSGMFSPANDDSQLAQIFPTVETSNKNINGNNCTENSIECRGEVEGKADYSTVVVPVEKKENRLIKVGKRKEESLFFRNFYEAKSLSITISSDDEENAHAVDMWKKKMSPVNIDMITHLNIERKVSEKSEEEMEMEMHFQRLSMESSILNENEINDHPSAIY